MAQTDKTDNADLGLNKPNLLKNKNIDRKDKASLYPRQGSLQ
jgi:hypothetical protein